MTKVSVKKDFTWTILGILLCMLVGFSALFAAQLSTLSKVNEDLNNIEYLSSSTQRLVKLVLLDYDTEKIEYYINDQTELFLNASSNNALSVLDQVAILLQANEVVSSWGEICRILEEDSENSTDLALASDNHYFRMTELSLSVNDYAETISDTLLRTEMILLAIICAIGLIIANNILNTHVELRQSRELAKVALLDTATGLYNRSKCQEIFRANSTTKDRQQPAIIVFDLNNLKKINDTEGNRVGDELIYCFAASLKMACSVHIIKPFVGRYGGDEFIVFYEDIDGEEEIKIFLKELEYITDGLNLKQVKFNISYSVGYAISCAEGDEKMTLRQLFDRADEAMYANKREQKKRKSTEKEDF